MRSTVVLLATISALSSAHSDPRDVHAGLPKLVGGSKLMANLKRRNLFSDAVTSGGGPVEAGPQLEARFTETCGPGVGNCDAGYCCSAAGYCGTTEDYCSAPDCQFQYGPACDANTVPAGASTSGIARPKIGNIPYGGINTAGVQDCIKLGVIAFSYDDGPYIYTEDLLDLLDSYGAKATFFITGNNLGKGEIDNCSTGYPQLIKRMYNSGHQVASHTWSHQDLSTLTTAQFNNQIYYNEMAFRNILGVIPTYLRPPYSSCNTTCSNHLSTMGYHATYFDLDTEGYLNDSPTLIQNSKNIYLNTTTGVNPAQNDFLLIEHDIHYQTVYNLTKFILDTMAIQGWGVPVTVGECLDDPVANWYRSAGAPIATCAAGTYTGIASTPTATSTSTQSNTSSSSVAVSTTAASSSSTKSSTSSSSATTSTTGSAVSKTISTDGSCGGKITCQGSSYGNCCSQYGWCGSASTYCGTGCQSAFGTCGSSSSLSSSSSSKTSSTTSTTSTTTSTLALSTDGTCSGTGKETCLNSTFGNCCSQYGWCGSTATYCGTGCQAGFGTCS